uniref:Cyclin-dependent kinases regulatory subunit n=1 Tax=Monodelphis domestica TaxID=13616 RepID=A0A5F8GXR1_MONDO
LLPKEICRRHVVLSPKLVPKTHLLSESEWRNLGVQQSRGGRIPEPHISLSRQPLPEETKGGAACAPGCTRLFLLDGCRWLLPRLQQSSP